MNTKEIIKDYVDYINACEYKGQDRLDRGHIGEYIASIHYDILDNAETMADVMNVEAEIEDILKLYIIVNAIGLGIIK